MKTETIEFYGLLLEESNQFQIFDWFVLLVLFSEEYTIL